MSRPRAHTGPPAPTAARPRSPVHPVSAVTTPAGTLRLVPVDPDDDADVALVHRWMGAGHVHRWWDLALPLDRLAEYLGTQAADAHSRPFFGDLVASDRAERVAYLELYRADLDPLARHYDARPHDLGVHLLIGPLHHTGRGLGRAVIAGTRDALLTGHPAATRVVAEPDVRNTASIRAFTAAGFTRRAELRLPDKTAALMVSDRPASRDAC